MVDFLFYYVTGWNFLQCFFTLLTFGCDLGIIYYTNNSNGPVRVSTGILRYDKRGGLDNPVIMSTLKLNDNNNVALAA